MGVVAMSAEQVGPLARPLEEVARSFSMDPGSPVSIEVAVAFPAKLVAFGEINQFAVIKPQFVPVLWVMAVQAPSHGFGMVDLDGGVLVFQLPFLGVQLHGGMAIAAGKHPLGERGRRNRKFVVNLFLVLGRSRNGFGGLGGRRRDPRRHQHQHGKDDKEDALGHSSLELLCPKTIKRESLGSQRDRFAVGKRDLISERAP
jgi:hypothetical protein